jgi:hypothetical protein
MTWYDKNMLFGDLMSNVDENVNESESLGEDPIALDEPNEDEVKHCHGLRYFGILLAISWPRICWDTFGNIMA